MRFALFLLLLAPSVWLLTEDDDYKPAIAEASNEGQLAIPRFKVPANMQVELAAAEPVLANPVAFNIDSKGNVFVCETFRQQKGVEDNRYHMGWLNDDLAAQTVDDRVKMFRKHLSDKADDYTVEHDRIRMLSDKDGDGTFESSTVFADGFNDIADGTGAGIMEFNGDIFYTCIPKLYKLKDDNNDGVADKREAMSDGYGVRVAFRGHDMHGLTVGPDGLIYYSIGDRGYNVTTKEGRKLHRPDTGAVFRCEPDGSHLEVFAYGFRNPQELAFDDYGNLFTGDNNSDSGDQARWVYIVEGADIGWRMFFQYLEDRGPWNRERMWYPYKADEATTKVQPAFILPPIINISDGPSGLTYYPGVGLSDRYKGHFFLADFRGTAGNSGIRSFSVKPKGASFELTDSHKFIWSILATDVEFAYDGSMLITDWVNGWEGEGKGRLYRFFDKTHRSEGQKSQKLIAEGFNKRGVEELEKRLSHPDKRVRQGAQFAMAKPENLRRLVDIARKAGDDMPRIHAIWALGQLGRRQPLPILSNMLPLLDDTNAEIRAQAMRTMSDICGRKVPKEMRVVLRSVFTKGLKDGSDRVQSFAAIGLNKVATKDDTGALLALLGRNNDADPVLRHAAIFGLVKAAAETPEQFVRAAKRGTPATRRAAVVVLRRLKSPLVAEFLEDEDINVVVEAARAIDSEGIAEAEPALAKWIDKTDGMPDALLRRVMNAAFRQGKVGSAAAIAKLAASESADAKIRQEAVAELVAWNEPPPLDRVDGRWRPLDKRSVEGLGDAVKSSLPAILASDDDKIREAGIRMASVYGVKDVAPTLRKLLTDESAPQAVRAASLEALDKLDDENLNEGIEAALASSSVQLRNAGRQIVMRRDPGRGAELMTTALQSGRPAEQQVALLTLANAKGEQAAAADTAITLHFDKMLAGEAAPETHLETLEAAALRNSDALKSRLEKFEASRDKKDPLAAYRESLAGGNAQRGRGIFFGRSAASCRRCHKVGNEGGAVGPELTTIAKERNREYLLESIVNPNAKIAKGFETIVLAMESGKIYTGVVKEQDEKTIKLMDANGAMITVQKDEIEEQAKGLSGMPADLIKQLTKSQLRDLVEYLAQQTQAGDPAKSEHR